MAVFKRVYKGFASGTNVDIPLPTTIDRTKSIVFINFSGSSGNDATDNW